MCIKDIYKEFTRLSELAKPVSLVIASLDHASCAFECWGHCDFLGGQITAASRNFRSSWVKAAVESVVGWRCQVAVCSTSSRQQL